MPSVTPVLNLLDFEPPKMCSVPYLLKQMLIYAQESSDVKVKTLIP